ncbi:MAG: ABC transporter ATP-binding protein [Rhizobiales bacterium]|nr:ABC transporter ATP-binding protein [Hyphomicrobiales bacterium]
MSASLLIQAHAICRHYTAGSASITALRPTSLTIRHGEFIAILGPSGSGKSTLMNIMGLLDLPSSGRFLLDGQDCAKLSARQLAQLRNRFIGFVFQAYYLLPRQTIVENVELPLIYAGANAAERRRRAVEALAAVRLSHRLGHFPGELSGGEQQRAAIARAIVSRPSLVLADEPTGALDSTTGQEIMGMLTEINRGGRTVILVTHDQSVARQARRVIAIRDGTIQSDQRVGAADFETSARPARRQELAMAAS